MTTELLQELHENILFFLVFFRKPLHPEGFSNRTPEGRDLICDVNEAFLADFHASGELQADLTQM